jgi:hypothetical protein
VQVGELAGKISRSRQSPLADGAVAVFARHEHRYFHRLSTPVALDRNPNERLRLARMRPVADDLGFDLDRYRRVSDCA